MRWKEVEGKNIKKHKNIYKLLSFALLLFHSLFFALWTRQFTSILPHSSSLFWVSCFHSWTLLPHIESDIHRRGQSKQLAGAEFGNFIHVLSLVHFYGDRRSLIARWSFPEAINLLHSGAVLRFFVCSNRKFQFHNSGQQEWVLWSAFFITFPCHNYRVPH